MAISDSEICPHGKSIRDFRKEWWRSSLEDIDKLPITIKGRFIEVHKGCFKPFKNVWFEYLQECEGCMSEFSSPYEMECCRRCSKLENTEFIGWTEVVDKVQEILADRLTTLKLVG